MSALGTKCKHCDQYAVECEDDGEGGYQRICTSCGAVNDGMKLVSMPGEGHYHSKFSQSNSLPDKYTRLHSSKLPNGLLTGRDKIRCVCSTLALKSFQESAMQLFDQLYYEEKFKHALVETKVLLAVWCVFIEARKACLPISLDYVGKCLGLEVSKLFSIHKECIVFLSIELPHQDVNELLDLVIANYFKATIEYSIATKDLTKELVMLCKQSWISSGRHPQYILMSAFYMAWQSEDFVQRKSTPIRDICKPGVSWKTCTKRINELRKILGELAEHIPWVDCVTNDTVGYYMKDIVKHHRSLMLDAMRKIEREQQLKENVRKESDHDDVNLNKVGKNIEETSNDTFEKRKQDVEDENVFMPPSYKRARRRSVEREEILEYFTEGKKNMQEIAQKLNHGLEHVQCD